MSLKTKDAPVSGLKGLWHRGGLYVLTAVSAGFAGIAFMFRLRAAGPAYGFGFEMDALLAVVAGGLWLGGNRPNVPGAMIAGFGLVMFSNLCSLLGLDVSLSIVFKAVGTLIDLLLLWGYNALMSVQYRNQKT
jgi:ribose/xylose/arabinose/galactoside ABC-type transport system permease subunit